MMSGQIGPNAIIQVVAVLENWLGSESASEILQSVGLGHYADVPPVDMVSERDVADLHAAVWSKLPQMAEDILYEAGLRTGNYLLAHRIPRFVQPFLRMLPAAWSAQILAKAIARHAYTFAGSGLFTHPAGKPFRFYIHHGPLCQVPHAGSCAFYRGTFAKIFQRLVHRHSGVQETQCESYGAGYCEFRIDWDSERHNKARF